MSDIYAVVGNPIKHSKSPEIHKTFATETSQDLIYSAELAEIGAFAEFARAFAAKGGKGCNVTVPFKQDAWEFVGSRSERAELAGAVNTIVFKESGETFGDNTDGIGMVRDIRDNHDISFTGKRVLVLGAGGAVRGVILPMLDEKPASLTIANRTASKAVDLADIFRSCRSESGIALNGCGYPDLDGQSFDIIINGTSAGLSGEIPPLPGGVLAKGGFCYDMVYSDEPTAFVKWGYDNGAALSVDGLGMLVEQAAESFYIWRNVRPDTGRVISEIFGRK